MSMSIIGGPSSTPVALNRANTWSALQTFSAGISCTTLTDSGLTAGRLTFAGTAGILSDSANLLALTGPLAATTTEYGAYLNLTSSGTRNTVRTLQVDFTMASVTDSSAAGTAFWANAKSGGSSDFNHFVGVESYADHAGSGTIGAMYGLNVYLFRSGSGTVTNLYGLNIAPPATMTGITNAYGIYIGDFTSSKYSIFTGTGIARFGGTLSCVDLATFAAGAVFGTDPGGTAALRIGGVPDSTYGNLLVADTSSYAASVGGVIGLAGKYTSGGAYANFAEIAGRKADATDGNYVGVLALRVQAGGSPYMHDVLTFNGSTDLATFIGGVSCTTLTATGKITTISAVPGSFATLADVQTWLAANFT